MNENKGQILIYKTPVGTTEIEVALNDETVWLTQKQMAVLFQKDSDTIGLHIKNVYQDAELQEYGTTGKNSVVQKEGSRNVKREVNFYNLDVIISVGYRVNSIQGTHFRIWATRQLREFMIKGFLIDDEKLKGTNSAGSLALPGTGLKLHLISSIPWPLAVPGTETLVAGLFDPGLPIPHRVYL